MNYTLKSTRLSALVLVAMTAVSVARADVIAPTATLPPATGQYNLPLVCLPLFCLVDANVSNFHITSDTFLGGNEQVVTNATFAASVFQNSGGSPGAFVSPLSIVGFMDFTYFLRTSPVQVGTFNAQITDFDFAGTFTGRNFEVRQSSTNPSLGVTTITPVPPETFRISSFFDVFAELSLDNGPFVPGPPRHSDLEDGAVPEPGSIGLAVTGLIGLGIAAGRRRRVR